MPVKRQTFPKQPLFRQRPGSSMFPGMRILRVFILFLLSFGALEASQDDAAKSPVRANISTLTQRYLVGDLGRHWSLLYAREIGHSFFHPDLARDPALVRYIAAEFKRELLENGEELSSEEIDLLIEGLRSAKRRQPYFSFPPPDGLYQSFWLALAGSVAADLTVSKVRAGLARKAGCLETLTWAGRAQSWVRRGKRVAVSTPALTLMLYISWLRKNDSWWTSRKVVDDELIPLLESMKRTK